METQALTSSSSPATTRLRRISLRSVELLTFLQRNASVFGAKLAYEWMTRGGFILMLFVYMSKPSQHQTLLRRTTELRIKEQMPRVASFLRDQDVSAGAASTTYMAVTQARLPKGAALQVPDTATFHHLQYIDRQQESIDQSRAAGQQVDQQDYVVIRVRIHDVPVPMQVNISNLREALGLHSYSLRPPFRAPVDVNKPSPDEDMDDIDHQE